MKEDASRVVEADTEPQQPEEEAQQHRVRRCRDQQRHDRRQRERDREHPLRSEPIDEYAGRQRAEAEREREAVRDDAQHEQPRAELVVDA